MDEQADAVAEQGVHDLESLIVDDAEFSELETLLDPFNIFEALGIVSQEQRHSDFLAFLSEPARNHGLGDTFVYLPIAIVVDVIADLRRVGVNRRIGVVAVGVVSDKIWRLRARSNRGVRGAESVTVRISIEGLGNAFVYLPIAIVVYPIAGLSGAWIPRRQVYARALEISKIKGSRP